MSISAIIALEYVRLLTLLIQTQSITAGRETS